MEALYQKIEIEESRLFIVKSNIVPYFDDLLHFHPEYELCYINEGNGHCLIGDKLLPYEKGDLFLLGPNLTHSWKSDYSNNKHSHSLVIQLNYKLWKGPFFSGKELTAINQFFNKSNRGIKFSSTTKVLVAKKMFEILECTNHMENLLRVMSILDMLANSESFEYIASPVYQPVLKQNDYHKVNSVYSYVHENYGGEISLDEVSRLLHMTNSGFCRYFKKLTRRTFFSYLNEYRIGVACRLLNQSDLNTTEISFKSGFQSISNFNKQFKLITGFNPREYKKQTKG